MKLETLVGLIIIVGIPAAAVAAIVLEKRRRVAMPDTKPYTWGIYTGLLNIVFGLGFLGGAVLNYLAPRQSGSLGDALLGVAFAAVEILAGYYTIRRRRAAFVIATIFSLNPIWWIANTFYGRNRWRELLGNDDDGDVAAAETSVSASTQ